MIKVSKKEMQLGEMTGPTMGPKVLLTDATFVSTCCIFLVELLCRHVASGAFALAGHGYAPRKLPLTLAKRKVCVRD